MQGGRATLRFGLIPRGDEGSESERAFVAAAAEALERDVEVHRAADYRVVLTGLEQGLVDFAWLPPLVGGRALRAGLIDPVAIVMRYGDTEYRTALITRADSRIHELKDLRGVRVAWVDRESASGYVVLRAALAKAGVHLTDAFAHEVFLRSHAAVARAVMKGDVDVGRNLRPRRRGRRPLRPLPLRRRRRPDRRRPSRGVRPPGPSRPIRSR